MVNRCPTCKQPLDTQRKARICRNCKQPIRRHDKWRFVTEKGKTFIEHRHCDNPESYKPKSEDV